VCPEPLPEPDRSARIAGVRFERNGPVHYVEAGAADIQPGEMGIVEVAGEERRAMMLFTPAQLRGSELDVLAEGRILGRVSEELAVSLRDQAANLNGVAQAGLPPGWSD